MPRRIAVSLAAAITALAAMSVTWAHGNLDQKLTADPACSAMALRATASSSFTPRQEVVPTAGDLESVDVCLTVAGASPVNMNIRSGTAAAPGAVLASASVSAGAGTGWVHLNLPAALPTTPGNMFVIELSGFPGFVWRGTCPAVALPDCPTSDPDRYPPGVSSAAAVGDFGFRTYTGDMDADSVLDVDDNCPNNANPLQEHSDGDFIELGPYGKAYDDVTWPLHDTTGDACDTDDDNDGLADAVETSLPSGACPAATAPTNATLRDTDGDRALDGPECARGTDPASAASFPTAASCHTPTNQDLDLDGVLTYREVCYYNTDPLLPDSDGDGCPDGREIASINFDRVVNVIDLQQVANVFFASYIVHFDMTKDGSVNVIDLQFVANRFGSCP